jgi:LysM domain-containing protein
MIERPSHVSKYELFISRSLRNAPNSNTLTHTETFAGGLHVMVAVQNFGCPFTLTVEEGLQREVVPVPKAASVSLGFNALAEELFPWCFKVRFDKDSVGSEPGDGLNVRLEFFHIKPAPKETAQPIPAIGTTGIAAARVHYVQPGDSLWMIAQKFLGDGSKWSRIYDANKAAIGPNPDLIRPGQRLTIP